jgi:putative nucleotidyltransferase with HDIG domain
MQQEHILVVDDDPPLSGLIGSILEHSGYGVATADSAADALRYLDERPGCDLVVSDVRMPGTDGLTLLDNIRRDHPGMPVMMLSGVDDIHVASQAFRCGAVDYLLKPFDPSQLVGAVARAVQHGHLQKQSESYRKDLEQMVAARTSSLLSTMEDLERSYDITVQAMGEALDLRDAETEGHCRRVTVYTIALAREMGLPPEQLRTIARGAFLHDIGKIATPDSILLKPGKLTPEETEIMRLHCARGYEMVRKIPFLRDAAEIVYAHQETYDGTGYPRGLSGEEIPLGARIFAIADTLDAMTSDRPYRKANTFAKARAEIVRCSGTQFDPRIVEVFLRMPAALWRYLRRKVETTPSGAFGITI